MKSISTLRVLSPMTATLVTVLGASQTGCMAQSKPAPAAVQRFDFGESTKAPGYVAVNATLMFSAERGYGWVDNKDLALRDRTKPDDLNQDFVMGKGPATFRVAGLTPGRYLLTVVSGDQDYGDHVTRIRVSGHAAELPVLSPTTREFTTLSVTVNVNGPLDIIFDSPQNNWVVNVLALEPAVADKAPMTSSQLSPREPVKSTWKPEVFKNDPTKAVLSDFRKANGKIPPGFRSTGLTRRDYLKLIASEVDFWKTKQNADGAIIDPYLNAEFQYSTPAFAQAAGVLVAHGNRMDLLEPASKAMDWATRRLSERKAANSHEDFYPTMLAHAYRLLKPHAPAERVARWESDIRRIDPYKTYRMAMGSMNWNIVSLSGEALFQNLGLRDKNNPYVPDSLAAQGHHFGSPHGLYLEGPLAYDHFPRIFLADIVAQGYDGAYSKEVSEALRRAAITSLFMQSPWGELPAGHRSAHHQWNEAEQCVTYEIYAAEAKKAGDEALAGIYKRAAHLALRSMFRWVRPSGEMQIVKHWVDPEKRHAYEGYSAHSQYNLLPTAMLATAFEYAATTEGVGERPTPADAGGFVLEIPELHKVFANLSGTYVQLDTNADQKYDATGLIRIHMPGISPQLGPSDSLLKESAYNSPQRSPQTTGVGISWQDAAGTWRTLGETKPEKWTVKSISRSPQQLAFDVTYEGDFFGVSHIIEHYVLTPGKVELTTEIPNYRGPLRYTWPVLADDGRTESNITVNANTVAVSQDGGKTAQTFSAPGAASVRVETARYSNHNGWARLGIAEWPNPQNKGVTLVIAARNTP